METNISNQIFYMLKQIEFEIMLKKLFDTTPSSVS